MSRESTRSGFLSSLWSCTLVASFCLVGCTEPPRDVVLITVAGLRTAGPGASGEPALAALQAGSGFGVQLEATYVETLPSLAVLMTGDPLLEGLAAEGERLRLPEGVQTLAERFAAAGYDTIALSGHGAVSPLGGFARGFQRFDSPFSAFSEGILPDEQARVLPEGGGVIPAGQLVEEVLKTLSERDSHNPLFLWVHLADPELVVGQEEPASAYGLMAAEVESAIGVLAEHAALKQSLFVATSVHGLGLGALGEQGHGLFLSDEVIQIPAYLRDPGASAIPAIAEGASLARLHGVVLERAGLTGEGHSQDVMPQTRVFLGSRLFGWEEKAVRKNPDPDLLGLMHRAYRAGVQNDLATSAQLLDQAITSAPGALAPQLLSLAALSGMPATGTRFDERVVSLRGLEGLSTMQRLDVAQGLIGAGVGQIARELLDILDAAELSSGEKLALARLYGRLEAGEKAVGLLDQLIAGAGTAPELHELAGDLLLSRGNAYRARKAYLEAADTPRARSANLLAKLGDALTDLGEQAPALEAYAEAVRIDPAYRYPHARAGEIFLQQGKLGIAADAFVKSLAPVGNSVDQALLRVHLLAEKMLFAQAMVELDRAVEAGADWNSLLGLRARLEAGLGRAGKARDLLNRWASLAPRACRPRLELARLEAEMGEEKAALEHLGAAQALAPPELDEEVRADPVFKIGGPESAVAKAARNFHGQGSLPASLRPN